MGFLEAQYFRKSMSHLPKHTLHIGGKDRHLTFDFNAICTVEEKTGLNLLQASVSTVEARNLRALLFASLLRDEPALTIDEVGSWIDMKNLADGRAAVLDAWFASVDDGVEKDDAKPGEGQGQEA
jgi:hypothetical protein